MQSRIQRDLYRIIKGRTRYRSRDGLILYIYEPDADILEESYEIYDEAYDEAYKNGAYVQEEILSLLIENDYWSPLDDKEADKVFKELEEAKFQAFKNFYNKKELRFFKRKAESLSDKWAKLSTKKVALDHLTCHGVAELARHQWLMSETVYYKDGAKFNWDVDGISTPRILKHWQENQIPPEQARLIARSDPWRGFWTLSKNGLDLFGKRCVDLTSDQSRLVSFSKMYDGVHENPDQPNPKIIEDDIALDGWFVSQKRKMEAQRKEREVDSMTNNEKIKNAGEVFAMARTDEEVQEIYDINDTRSRGIIKERKRQIEEEGTVKFTDLQDVKLEIQMERQKMFADHMKRGGK